MQITIEGWDYQLELTPDRRLRVWHHVTPADGGYGREVDVTLPAGYLRTHAVDAFYDDIASRNTHPAPGSFSRAQEIEAFRETYRLWQLLYG